MQKLKFAPALALSAALLAVSLPVDARVGTPSGSRSSFSVSKSTASAPVRTPDRAGGGQSIGMRRSEAMREARAAQAERSQQAPAVGAARQEQERHAGSGASMIGSNLSRKDSGTSPSNRGADTGYGNRPDYGRQAEAAPARRDWTGAKIAGAALVAGAAGYAIADSRDSHQDRPTGYRDDYRTGGVTSSQAASDESKAAMPAPRKEPPSAQASSAPARPSVGQSSGSAAGAIFGILALLVIGGIAAAVLLHLLTSKPAARPAEASNPETPIRSTESAAEGSEPAVATSSSHTAVAADLVQSAPSLFRRIQDANNRGDLDELAELTDDNDLLQYFVSTIKTRTEQSRTRVIAVAVQGNRVLDFVATGASFTGSIHFVADIAEGDEPEERVEELWHFQKSASGAGTWKLAGIEQL